MRVAAHELVADRAQRIGNVEVTALGGDLGQEHRLEQEVAQLVAQGVEVPAIDGVHDLVGLLDDERSQRLQRLLPIPGAAVLGAQPPHQIDQPLETGSGGRALFLVFD